MLNYHKNLEKMPSYNGTEKDYQIKVKANEYAMNLPPHVEQHMLNSLGYISSNRYPNEEYDLLAGKIAKNFSVDKSQILFVRGSSEII